MQRTAGAVILLVAALSSCGDAGGQASAVDPAADPVDELSLHEGQFCPETLPLAPQETYGFGTDEAATQLPTLRAFDEAWLCSYETRDVAPSGANGAWFEWVRSGRPQRLSDDQLAAFSSAVGDLQLPGDGEYACTADLGPRHLVSLAWERDLTGVVVEDFGCGSVLLTDDPFVTIPGEATQPGTVSGVLRQPPGGLLAGLDVERLGG